MLEYQTDQVRTRWDVSIPNKIDHYGGVEAGVTLRPLFFKGFLGKPLGETPHYSRSIIRADWHSNQSNDGYVRILKLATYIYIVDRTLNNRDEEGIHQKIE